MITTSNSRTAEVTAIVVHQTQGCTSMRCLPEYVDRAMLRRSLPPGLRALGRTSGTGSVEDRRDDDTAAKEYSPPAPSVCHSRCPGCRQAQDAPYATGVPGGLRKETYGACSANNGEPDGTACRHASCLPRRSSVSRKRGGRQTVVPVNRDGTSI